MAETTYSRKLDATGRIMIPVKLRDQMGLVPGKEYYFSTLERDGRKFICIDCGSINDDLLRAMQLIQQNGMKIIQSND